VNRKISLDEAMRRSSDPVELEQMLGEKAGASGLNYSRK
jgi:hypothetical protein